MEYTFIGIEGWQDSSRWSSETDEIPAEDWEANSSTIHTCHWRTITRGGGKRTCNHFPTEGYQRQSHPKYGVYKTGYNL